MTENYNIDDFINVESPVQEKEIKFKRFKVPFKIKSLTAEEVADLRKQATLKNVDKKTHLVQRQVDDDKLASLVVTSSVVVPNLTNEKLQKHYSAIGQPELVIKRMLLAGEYNALAEAIMNISDINSDSANLVEEAKN